MPIDIERLRSQTPGCAVITHFNHAGSSLPPSQVTQAVIDHLHREALYGAMEAGIAAADAVDETRRSAASLIGADVDEVALLGSGTQGWGLAFAALPALKAGDRILIAQHEWGGNVSTLHHAARRAGAVIEIIPCDETGAASPDALTAMLDERVRLVALTWCPATNGLVNPVAAIGQVTRRAGVPYFVDAAQALGQYPVDVAELNCDALTGVGRKALRGPRGTGLLYLRRGFQETLTPPYLDVFSGSWRHGRWNLRKDALLFETGENSVAMRLGLGVAISLAFEVGIASIRTRIMEMAEELRASLASLPAVTVHDSGVERSSIVAFSVAGRSATAVRDALARKHITIAAVGSTYAPFDMEARGLPEIARASVSYLTTRDEIDRLVSELARLVR